MKATTTLITVLFVAILNVGAVLSAPVYHVNSDIKRADALVNVYTPGGAVPGQPPGVVPTGKRDVDLVEKSEELEDCAAPCDFYIRSVENDESADVYASGGAVPGQPPGVVPVEKRDVDLVEKSEELEDCAAPCDFYIRSVENDESADVYAPGGAVPGQPPGVVPAVKRDAELVEKSEEFEDCAAPCDFYIRSVEDDDTSSPAYAVPGTVSPILPRKVVPVGYYPFVDDETTNSKRAVEGAVAKAASYYWPPGFKGPRSKRAVEGSLTEATSSSRPLPGFTGPRAKREEAVAEATSRPGFFGPRSKRDETVAEATSYSPIRPGFTGPRSKRDEDATDCEPLKIVPNGFPSNGCDAFKRSEATVPLNPASGGYASGAPKRSEAKVPLSPASGGYASGAPKRSEAKVPLSPASGGYASGAPKRSEAKVPLNPAFGGYASGAPKRSEIDN